MAQKKLSLDDLDKIIAYLYENQGSNFPPTFVYKKLFGLPVDITRCEILFDKLQRDGYLSDMAVMQIRSEDDQKTLGYQPGYSISFEGILFIENSSFIWKKRPYRWNKIKGIINTIWTVAKIIMITLNALIILYLTYLLTKK